MGKVLDREIVECQFELQSYYYVYFQTITHEKGVSLLIRSAMG